MYTRPLRRTIRHLAQRLRMDGDTFIYSISLIFPAVQHTAKALIIRFDP